MKKNQFLKKVCPTLKKKILGARYIPQNPPLRFFDFPLDVTIESEKKVDPPLGDLWGAIFTLLALSETLVALAGASRKCSNSKEEYF